MWSYLLLENDSAKNLVPLSFDLLSLIRAFDFISLLDLILSNSVFCSFSEHMFKSKMKNSRKNMV